jgi:hypothetical protein
MKKRSLVIFALVAVAAGAIFTATAVTGGASSSGCKNFTWTGQSTFRLFDGQYHENGDVTKGDLKGGTYDLDVNVGQSGPFASGQGTVVVTLGTDTLSFQNGAFVKFPGVGPLGGIAIANGGTGQYAGATGDFSQTGVFDSDFNNQTAVSRTFSGQLCLP